MSSRNVTIVVIAVIVLVVIGYLGRHQIRSLVSGQSTPVTTQTPAVQSQTPQQSSSSGAVAEKPTVNETANGFSPASITIKAGDTVTWTNVDSGDHTVNSNPHPTHTDYPPLNLGLIQPGESKSLTFPTAGTYKYHDHLNPTHQGEVIVE